ncbi:MAG: tRNA epoxyqueuosine(34) reductase QueG [Planctomycetota bacterium]|nr:tRNA epoxyqueuosine(34) reductase QueG [Planctomycetota bacterium]
MKEKLREKARASGFELFGIARAGPAPDSESFREFVADGRHGFMGYLEKSIDVRCDPHKGFPWASSIVCLGRAYGPAKPGIPAGWIAAYARRRDYHETIGEALRGLIEGIRREFPCTGRAKAFVDSGPVAEKAWAAQAGLGFRGKNTLLIAPGLGSYLHLAVLLLEAELPPDAPIASSCGKCQRCIEACPTGAIVAPWRLDARRCVAYLTVELKGNVQPEDWPKVRSVFGCDICQDVCPFNRDIRERLERTGAHGSDNATGQTGPMRPAGETEDCHLSSPTMSEIRPGSLQDLAELIVTGRQRFDELFGDTPIRRATWVGLRLNAITAGGNVAHGYPDRLGSRVVEKGRRGSASGNQEEGRERLIEALKRCLSDGDGRIRERAEWALAQWRRGATS